MLIAVRFRGLGEAAKRRTRAAGGFLRCHPGADVVVDVRLEVRVELASHAEAERLADELEIDGRSVVRRWWFVLVGANNQDDAEELGRRLASRGKVHVEPSSGVAWQLLPRNPFAVFGVLGG